jgi:hypothetical protein
MQTIFQSQRPSDAYVETPVPSIFVQKLSSIGTVSTWKVGWVTALCLFGVHPISKEKADQLLAAVLYHIVRN